VFLLFSFLFVLVLESFFLGMSLSWHSPVLITSEILFQSLSLCHGCREASSRSVIPLETTCPFSVTAVIISLSLASCCFNKVRKASIYFYILSLL
jgi:hypothetical protein